MMTAVAERDKPPVSPAKNGQSYTAAQSKPDCVLSAETVLSGQLRSASRKKLEKSCALICSVATRWSRSAARRRQAATIALERPALLLNLAISWLTTCGRRQISANASTKELR